MPTRAKQKAASKAKPKRAHISFEKEPWYGRGGPAVQCRPSEESPSVGDARLLLVTPFPEIPSYCGLERPPR